MNARTPAEMRKARKTHENELNKEIQNLIDESRWIVRNDFDRDRLQEIGREMDEKIQVLKRYFIAVDFLEKKGLQDEFNDYLLSRTEQN